MKEKKTNLLQVLARRALLVALDGAIVAFSFYFALLLRADGAVEASWWPHNRALLYANLPWIVAVYLLSFLAGRLYTILWKYAGERDLIRLAGMIAVPTGIVYLVNRCFIHGVLFNSANAMAAVLIFLFIGGSRLAWRLFLNHPLGERLRGNTSKDPNRPVMIVVRARPVRGPSMSARPTPATAMSSWPWMMTPTSWARPSMVSRCVAHWKKFLTCVPATTSIPSSWRSRP